ncbi:MAG: hypothetical protein ACJAQT_003720 [Akkermansiaceae bacterium]|jgi:hypothetical protein
MRLLMISSEYNLELMGRKFLPLFIFGILGMIFAFVMFGAAPYWGYGFFSADEGEVVSSEGESEGLQERMRKKLNEIRLPEMHINDGTVEEAIEFLRLRSIELSPEKDETQKGFGFVVRSPRVVGLEDEGGLGGFGDVKEPNAVTFSLSARDVGLAEALDLICEEAGLRWWVDEEVLKIVIAPVRKGGEKGGTDDGNDPFSSEE